MRKGQPPELFEELTLRDSKDSTAKPAANFAGTDNPRHLRAIHALMQRARFKNDLQTITGASNTPELVAELRRRGLDTPCERVPVLDRDGLVTRPGVYSFNDTDRRKIRNWQNHKIVYQLVRESNERQAKLNTGGAQC
ncbi:MAG: hypothetical protein WCK93_03665 [Nitrosomonadales bacterium]